jgi:hypothetical protein
MKLSMRFFLFALAAFVAAESQDQGNKETVCVERGGVSIFLRNCTPTI